MICKVITPNIPKAWERDYLFQEGDKAKALIAVKSIFNTVGKAHRNDKVEQEPSGNKKPKESAHNPKLISTSTARTNTITLGRTVQIILTRSTTIELTIQRTETRNTPVHPHPARTRM